MKAEEFFEEIGSLLELEDELEINAETLIEDILEIDSLAHITLISYVKDELDVEIRVEDFAKLESLNDLIYAIGADKFN